MRETETELKRKATKILKKYGKFISYNPYPFGEPGTPDKIGCINGKMILIEFKRAGSKLTPLQEIRKREWEKAGASVWVINNIEDLKNKLKKEVIKNGNKKDTVTNS